MFIPDLQIKNDSLAVAMKSELAFHYTSPIGCAGGKARQAPYLTTLMPHQIDHFFEPFGGGMSTTYFLIHMGRVKATNCHVGDLHEPILNFHRVLQSDYERLTQRLLEYRSVHGDGNRDSFEQTVDTINKSSDSFERAFAYYIFNRLSMLNFRKYKKSAFAPSILTNGGGVTRQKILTLPYFGALFQGVSINKRSYKDALGEAVTLQANSFVFLDPPYEGFDESMYGVKFDFDEFAELCLASSDKCKFMITINDSTANRERFKDLNVFTRGVYYGMSKETKPEIVICNYDLPNLDFQLNLLGYERVSRNVSSLSTPVKKVIGFKSDVDIEPSGARAGINPLNIDKN
ncbi:MAG: DNA adenine methylase, partial [Rhodospirillaceae bacterium]|nr:DNA adenine methylase [Rhodospirillaceae bacterium]